MLKKVDVAVDETIEDLAEGNWRRLACTVFDLAAGGVDYSTSGGFVDDIKTSSTTTSSRSSTARSRCPTKP